MRYMAQERRRYAPNNIRNLRLERNLTIEDLVGLIGGDEISISTLARLEKGEMGLTLDYTNMIADALQVDPSALNPRARSGRVFPLVGRIAAGNWREAVEDAKGWKSVPADLDSGVNSFVLVPEGDSMDKLARPDGSWIVVDPDQRDLLDKKLYAMMTEAGETTFKQFFADPPRLEPCSSNPAHKPIPLGREPIIVIGKITFIGLDPVP